MMRRAYPLCSLLAAALLAGSAAAAPTDAEVRGKARILGAEALSLFDSGRFAEALEQFDRADAVFRAPTHGLMAARCLEKLGRLVEASQRYTAVATVELDAKASGVFRAAKLDAAKELRALLPRIPTVTLDVAGARAPDVSFTLDGTPLQDADAPSAVDPGPHRIEARSGAAVVGAADVTVAEGEARRVTLTLSTAPPRAPSSAALGPQAPPEAPGQTRQLLGWAGVGLGGAGLLLGGITGGMAMAAQADLDDSGCRAGVCPRSAQDDVDHYNALRAVSTAGFIAGGVSLAAGAALLLITPGRPAQAASPRATPWLSAGSAGIKGSF